MHVHRTSDRWPDLIHEHFHCLPIDPFPRNITVLLRPTRLGRPRTAPDRSLPGGDGAQRLIQGRSSKTGARQRRAATPDGDPQLPSSRERRWESLCHPDSPIANHHHHRRCRRSRKGLRTNGPRCGNIPGRGDRPAGSRPVDPIDPSLNLVPEPRSALENNRLSPKTPSPPPSGAL